MFFLEPFQSTVSPARNVLSRTFPVWTLFSVVRTNAEPLPGLTWRKSITRHTDPSKTIETPGRKSLLEIMKLSIFGRQSAFIVPLKGRHWLFVISHWSLVNGQWSIKCGL